MIETPGLPDETLAATRYRCLADLIVDRRPTPPIGGEAEWSELVSLALSEGVAPLLAWKLRTLPQVDVPASVAEQLRSIYSDAVFLSLLHRSVRARLCQQFSAKSIPVLLMKGGALTLTCYEDPATRPMSDLDVLVPRSALQEAAGCLEADGFRPLSGSLAREMRSPRGHLVYTHTKTDAVVELHWTIKGLGRTHKAAVAEIWADAQPANFELSAQVMRPGHTLPVLAAHMLLQHRSARLLWLYDLHRVLLATDAGEATVAREAAMRWHLAPCLAVALLSVRELFGTPLPELLFTWASATAASQQRQARRAALPLAAPSLTLPDGRLTDLVMNRDWSQIRALFPSPATLRRRRGATAEKGILAAYVSLLLYYLRRAPANCIRLWRYWLAAPSPPPSADESPRRPGGLS